MVSTFIDNFNLSVRSHGVTLLILTVVLVGIFIPGTVAAQPAEAELDSIICQSDSPDEGFESILNSLLTVGAALGAVAGTVVYALVRAAKSVKPGYDNIDGKKALISGWSVIIILYFGEFVLDILFDINIGCITP
jgi:hypothetical protein